MKPRTWFVVATFAMAMLGLAIPAGAAEEATGPAEETVVVAPLSSDVQLGYDPFVLGSSFGSLAAHCELWQCFTVDACIGNPPGTPCGFGVPCTCKRCHGVYECFP
jgi:hypothetical protein